MDPILLGLTCILCAVAFYLLFIEGRSWGGMLHYLVFFINASYFYIYIYISVIFLKVEMGIEGKEAPIDAVLVMPLPVGINNKERLLKLHEEILQVKIVEKNRMHLRIPNPMKTRLKRKLALKRHRN